ncbi:hypothetical protein N9017_02220 [Akkermansiaceae bacterium]|nr:hypothetical protein [Akkermansiaceae bacterium]
MKKTVLGIVSIAVGGIIYIIWREQSLLMFEWFDLIGLSYFIGSIRYFGTLIGYPPEWVVFSLPNALWVLGGFLLFFSIWEKESFERNIWLVLFSTIAIGSEIAQLIGFIPGTYDSVDMFLMCVVITLAISINKKKLIKEGNNAQYA